MGHCRGARTSLLDQDQMEGDRLLEMGKEADGYRRQWLVPPMSCQVSVAKQNTKALEFLGLIFRFGSNCQVLRYNERCNAADSFDRRGLLQISKPIRPQWPDSPEEDRES